MKENRIKYMIMNLVKDTRFILLVCISIMFGLVFSSTFLITRVYAETFSENLEHEQYTPEIDISEGWYDGVCTFWYEEPTCQPNEWLTSAPYGFVRVESSKTGHTNILHIYTTSSAKNSARYWFGNNDTNPYTNMEITDYMRLNISFWILNDYTSKYGFVDIYLQTSDYFRVFFRNDGKLCAYDSLTSTTTVLQSYSANTWYFIEISLYETDTRYFMNYQVKVNDVIKADYFVGFIYEFLLYSVEYIDVYTQSTDGYFWFDCLNYYKTFKNAWYPYSQHTPYRTEIQGLLSKDVDSFIELDDSRVFSLYNSMIHDIADKDNNYRNTFITDNLINVDLLKNNRILRLKGTNDIDKKYKIIQLFFDNLDNNNSWLNNNNQSIYVRIDSHDNSDNLINKIYFNLDFNKTDGYLYWYWYQRESLSNTRFIYYTHNPTFSFSDYLKGYPLISMEINLHFFLAYNLTDKLFFIRTTVAFNQNYSSVYSYDKIISLGKLDEFYDNQDELIVKYIDYFNRNNASDYLNNTFYTYNNLRGIRTLHVNNTDYYFNFLTVGYFSDLINFPENPGQEPDALNPTEPSGSFWWYNSIQMRFSTNYSIIVYNLTWNYPLVELYSEPAKYPIIWFDSTGMDNWGFWGEWNWLRDGLIALFNIVFAGPINLVGYVLVLAINYILMFLIVGGVMVLSINVIGLGVAYGFTYLVWGILTLWNVIVYPFLEWLYVVLLPVLLELLWDGFIGLISLIVWMFTGFTADYSAIFATVGTMIIYLIQALVEFIGIFITYIPYFTTWIVIYIQLIGMLWLKYLYVKFRGFTERAKVLKETAQTFTKPISIVYSWIIRLLRGGSKDSEN